MAFPEPRSKGVKSLVKRKVRTTQGWVGAPEGEAVGTPKQAQGEPMALVWGHRCPQWKDSQVHSGGPGRAGRAAPLGLLGGRPSGSSPQEPPNI